MTIGSMEFNSAIRLFQANYIFELFFVSAELGLVVIGDLGVHDQIVLSVVFQVGQDRLRHVGVDL